MCPFHCSCLLERAIDIRTEYAALRPLAQIPTEWKIQTYWMLTNRGSASNQLTTSAEPLPLWDERNTITFLMNGQVTPVAKDNGIRVLAITIIADGALGILLLALTSGLTIDCSCTARARAMRLWGLWVGFGDAFSKSVLNRTCSSDGLLTFLQCMPLFLNLRNGDLENRRLDNLHAFFLS